MDYMFRKNYPLTNNYHKNSKSQSIKNKNNKKYINKTKYPPSNKQLGETTKSYFGENELKKFKSTSKTISVNSLPKIDSYYTTNSFFPKTNKGQFELFVRNKTSFLKEDNLNDEEFCEIELLWDELGITDEYQDQFELYLDSINNYENKKKFLSIEKKNLEKIKDALLKFSKEKKTRIKNIEILKKLNNNIKENSINGDNTVNKEFLKDINDSIKAIRINSINVVNSLIKVREAFTCFSIEDKINFDKINKNYLFDNNYLLKMNSELSFLKYSEIAKIFKKNDIEEEENIDTFLTVYKNYKNDKNNSNILSKELLSAIDKCRYYILEDSFLNNIKVKKILKIKTKNHVQKINNKYKGKSLITLSNNGFNDLGYSKNIDFQLHKIKNELGKNYNNIFLNNNRQKQNTIPNNKRYNFLKNKIKIKNNNIVVERDETPYKINSDLDSIKNNCEFKKEEEQHDNKDILSDEFKNNKVNNDNNKDSNINKKSIKYNEEEIINNNNDLDEKKEIENENKNKNVEEIKEKKDDEDMIVDIDYLDDIKNK